MNRNVATLGLIVGPAIVSLSLLAACNHNCGCHEHDDGVEVKRSDVPAAVMATIEREAAGGTIGEIEKEMEGGKIVYSAEVTINGKQWEVEVAEDGTLLGKELEGDDDEKDDDKVTMSFHRAGASDVDDLMR